MSRPRKEMSLVKTFLDHRVLTLPQLSGQLGCSSRTVLRRLKEHSYFSSYNHCGKFMTIEEVASFDSCGLWLCKGARFSKHRTLRNTVHQFVQGSEKGMTHGELAMTLGLRVHDPLLHLVNEGKIRRERLGPSFVYLSRKRLVQSTQRRQRIVFMKTSERPRATSQQKIATLLELVMDPKVERQAIVARVKRKGISISHEVVNTIFENFELEKKRAL